MKIYVASSWRNPIQEHVVKMLREVHHEVYDFKNPKKDSHGFNWREVDEGWQDWSVATYRGMLTHPIAQAGFNLDMLAMEWADEFCLVLPSGRSAHLEAGWAIGRGKRTSVFIPEKYKLEPELMYLLGEDRTKICVNDYEVLDFHSQNERF
jgi:hypothetical protein